MPCKTDQLTERQLREVDYHRSHAEGYKYLLAQPFSFDVITNKKRRWWNAYWEMYSFLLKHNVQGKKVLVLGCGFGDDALRLAMLGADVYACDLSPDSLNIAMELAAKQNLQISFDKMPAEHLEYESDFFDCVIARDILHHVDIPLAMQELKRVCRHDALFVMNEIYSHSLTSLIRCSNLVTKHIYPLMQSFVYEGQRPYITNDERKLSEVDISQITESLVSFNRLNYYNFFVGRIIPESYKFASICDRLLLVMLKPFAPLLAGRILIAAHFAK